MLRYDFAGRQTCTLSCGAQYGTALNKQNKEKKVVFRLDRNLDALCYQQFVKFDGMTFKSEVQRFSLQILKGVKLYLFPDSNYSSTILQTCKK